MDFQFDINSVLPEEITAIDFNLMPFKPKQIQEKGLAVLKENLEKIIDKMGAASSKAQGIKSPITTSGKMSVNEQRLYILKETMANGGKGAVVGLIKVGKKRLFVIDIHSQQLEVNPLCVLDFYVHEAQQRSGFGLRLFKKMLEGENVKPQYLAYDRPSNKFLKFLKKHFELHNVINQMNKFVVFDAFFRDLSAVGYVPRNKRFVSSAPVDKRMHSRPDTRQISSASSFCRLNITTPENVRLYNGSGNTKSTLSNGNNNASSSAGLLPPRPSGKPGELQREVTWYRRNASHISFARNSPIDKNMITDPFITAGGRGSLYSRHACNQSRLVHNYQGALAKSNVTETKLPKMSPSGFLQKNPSVDVKPVRNEKISDHSHNDFKPHSNVDVKIPLHSKTNQSYTVGSEYKQSVSHSDSQGTSWNLFGVPANICNRQSNPHSNYRTSPYR